MAKKLPMELNILSNDESEAVHALIALLSENYPDEVAEVLLYGSKARGDSTQDSDIDLLVILKNENRALRRTILQLAARVSLNYDVILSLLVMSATRWESHRGLSLYHNILRDARPMTIAG